MESFLGSSFDSEFMCVGLTKEEKEALLAKKIEDIRRKNVEREKRHAEIEADKRLAAGSKASVKVPAAAAAVATATEAYQVAPGRAQQETSAAEAAKAQDVLDYAVRSGRASVRRSRGGAVAGRLAGRASRDSSLLKYPLNKPGSRWRSSRESSLVSFRTRSGPKKGRDYADRADASGKGRGPMGNARPAAAGEERPAVLPPALPSAADSPSQKVGGRYSGRRSGVAAAPVAPGVGGTGKSTRDKTDRAPWRGHRRNGSGDVGLTKVARGMETGVPRVPAGDVLDPPFPDAERLAGCGVGGSNRNVVDGSSSGRQEDDSAIKKGGWRGKGIPAKQHDKSYDEMRKRNAAAYEEELQQRSASHPSQCAPMPTLDGSTSAQGFLADRGRDATTDFSKTNMEHRMPIARHRRNFGGVSADLSLVKKKVKVVSEMQQAAAAPSGPRTTRLDLEMRMTGRERLEYSAWREERERVDVERLGRARNACGGWRREWDADKNTATPRRPLSWPVAFPAALAAAAVPASTEPEPLPLLESGDRPAVAAGQQYKSSPPAGAPRKTVGSGRFVSQGDKRKMAKTASASGGPGTLFRHDRVASHRPPSAASRGSSRRPKGARDNSSSRTPGDARSATRPPLRRNIATLNRRWSSGNRKAHRAEYGGAHALERPSSNFSSREDIVIIHVEPEDDESLASLSPQHLPASSEDGSAVTPSGSSPAGSLLGNLPVANVENVSGDGKEQESGERQASEGPPKAKSVHERYSNRRNTKHTERGQPQRPAARGAAGVRGAATAHTNARETEGGREPAKEEEWEDVAEAEGSGDDGGESGGRADSSKAASAAGRGRRNQVSITDGGTGRRRCRKAEAPHKIGESCVGVRDWAADVEKTIGAKAGPEAAAKASE